jgi:DNA-binding NtrC family response regulator
MDAPAAPVRHGLVGRSPALAALIARIDRLAPVDVPVLIVGESGTGKELVAAALHRAGPRAGRPFEPVNCGALTAELLRSELFGHERGAFTGALERRAGLVREADGGTLFLDEIGELAPTAQAAFLRFLATGELRAVGAARTVRADVRVLAATHRDLLAEVRRGAFREDLYYRLRRVVLRVPPLREREEDLPLLVDHIRRRANPRYGLAVEGVTVAGLARLARHPWPGNVRELEAVVEEAMLAAGRGWLGPGAFQLDPPVERLSPARRSSSGDPLGSPTRCLQVALTLAATRGTVTRGQLAAECGVSGEVARRTLVDLTRLGHLRRVGAGPRTRYVAG